MFEVQSLKVWGISDLRLHGWPRLIREARGNDRAEVEGIGVHRLAANPQVPAQRWPGGLPLALS